MVKKHLIKQALSMLGMFVICVFMAVSCFFGVAVQSETPTLRRIWTGVIALIFIWLAVYQVKRFIAHRKDVMAFEKDFLPEKLDDILEKAEKRYGTSHFLLSDRVISLEETVEFEYKDITLTAIAKRRGYRAAFKPKALVMRLKNGVTVSLGFSASSKDCEKAKAFIDERADILPMIIPTKGKK